MSAFASSSLRSFMRASPRAATPARTFTTSSSRSAARLNITGRLGAVPEVRTSGNGNEYVRYNIASKDGNKEKTTSWFTVSAFVGPQQQEFLIGLPKGSIVSVDAEATFRRIQNAEGQPQSILYLTQRGIEIVQRHRANEENSHAEESRHSEQ